MTTVSAPSSATASPPAKKAELDKLKATAKQFEAVFVRQMIGAMREAKLADGTFDTSASDQFRDMGDARLAEQLAGHGAIGIADLLVKQLGARLGAGATAADAAAAAADKAK